MVSVPFALGLPRPDRPLRIASDGTGSYHAAGTPAGSAPILGLALAGLLALQRRTARSGSRRRA